MINTNKMCVVIGGSNIDIIGRPYEKLIVATSNPGGITIANGGVGRNIAENLALFGVSVSIITVVGDDIYGKKILLDAEASGISTKHSLIVKNAKTPVYLSVLNESGDMVCAVSCMDAIDILNPSFIAEKHDIIKNAALIIVDANLSFESIDYITSKYRHIPIILDTVSAAKCLKSKYIIDRFHTIKPNRIEAENLTGFTIQSESDIKNTIAYFINAGVKRVYLTLGEDGICYGDGTSYGYIPKADVTVVNATGAGDAFMAGIAYCHLNDMPIDYTAKFAQAAAAVALSHENAVNPNISVKEVTKALSNN